LSLNFTAIDFETANGKRASVCQIGVTKVENGEIVDSYCSMVTPPAGFRDFALRNIEVHGIRPADIIGAPGWGETLSRLIDFAAGTPLVGHNVSFEKSVVKAACEAVGVTQPQFTWGCSLKMARKHLPGHASYSLGKISQELQLAAFSHHDAGEDATASAVLALHTAKTTGITDFHKLFAL